MDYPRIVYNFNSNCIGTYLNMQYNIVLLLMIVYLYISYEFYKYSKIIFVGIGTQDTIQDRDDDTTSNLNNEEAVDDELNDISAPISHVEQLESTPRTQK